jgi:uncharacterized repeat protein (TIGR03803 family)
MSTLRSYRSGFGIGLAVALLTGCGGSGTGMPPTQSTSAVLRKPPIGNGYKLLYSFKGGTYGWFPASNLLAVNDKLYGTTGGGGDVACFDHGCGTVFELSFSGVARVLHRFTDYPKDGAFPSSGLTAVGKDLYGTTAQGGRGPNGVSGTVYRVSLSGQERLVYSFAYSGDGRGPDSDLVAIDGTLYGATVYGGYSGCYNGPTCGTVFKVSTSGKEQILHYFKYSYPPKDGVWPHAGLTLVNDELYGTTGYGGTYGHGTIYKISTSGKKRTIYNFQGGHDGVNPSSKLTFFDGDLYGTTVGGGAYGLGTVFAVSPSGKERLVYVFKGRPTDGVAPEANVIVVNGSLYGTTLGGGRYKCFSDGFGCGTVFKVSTSGKESVLYSFKGGRDGALPSAGLTAVNSVLYGTTNSGGSGNCAPGSSTSGGCGTVFQISP